VDILYRLLAHNEWATRVLVERCGGLSAEHYHREFEIGPGTLHKTCAHIVEVMFVWGESYCDGFAGRGTRSLEVLCGS